MYQSIPGLTVLANAALSRAQSLLGSSITRVYGTDFDTNNWITTTLVAGGTANLSTTERGGVINLSTSATANSQVVVKAAGVAGLVVNPTTDKWYWQSYQKWTTGVDAAGYISCGLIGFTNPGLYVGALGNVSTVNFAYDFYNNAGAATNSGSLGVALDTNYHLIEEWGDTTNFYVAIDGTLRLTLAIPASFTNAASIRWDSQNGATAANRQQNVNYAFICTQAS
jgi:hypothetical protein